MNMLLAMVGIMLCTSISGSEPDKKSYTATTSCPKLLTSMSIHTLGPLRIFVGRAKEVLSTFYVQLGNMQHTYYSVDHSSQQPTKHFDANSTIFTDGISILKALPPQGIVWLKMYQTISHQSSSFEPMFKIQACNNALFSIKTIYDQQGAGLQFSYVNPENPEQYVSHVSVLNTLSSCLCTGSYAPCRCTYLHKRAPLVQNYLDINKLSSQKKQLFKQNHFEYIIFTSLLSQKWDTSTLFISTNNNPTSSSSSSSSLSTSSTSSSTSSQQSDTSSSLEMPEADEDEWDLVEKFVDSDIEINKKQS